MVRIFARHLLAKLLPPSNKKGTPGGIPSVEAGEDLGAASRLDGLSETGPFLPKRGAGNLRP